MKTNDRLGGFSGLLFFAKERGRLSDMETEKALDLIERASRAIGIAGAFDRERELWDVFERSIIAGWTGDLYGVWGNEDVAGIVRAILAACESREERARVAKLVGVEGAVHPSAWGDAWDMSHSQEFHGHMMVEAEARSLSALTLLYLDIASEQRANPGVDKGYAVAKAAMHITETIFAFICEFAPPKMATRAACELYRLTMDTVEGFEAGEIPATSLASNVGAARARMLYVSLDGGL